MGRADGGTIYPTRPKVAVRTQLWSGRRVKGGSRDALFSCSYLGVPLARPGRVGAQGRGGDCGGRLPGAGRGRSLGGRAGHVGGRRARGPPAGRAWLQAED